MNKLKEEFYKTQCEEKEDSERMEVYENDAEFVADWWLQKIAERDKELLEKLEAKKKVEKGHWEVTDAEMIGLAQTNGFNGGLETAISLIKGNEL